MPETEEIVSDGAKELYVEVTRPETHGSTRCVWPWKYFDAKDELDGDDDGDSITLTLRRMTKQEFEDLGEFDGW